ncbi:MAG: Wzt carbohydrate-binding domain-containing protein [Candidatus Dojkabacteria bacterium]|nr:Wzt carbohydrate-binding domain-containing protein [Candidatus Dojkabacteria bacterium]MDQ7020219.1 Wzt carbohydrate-binding domain-containing protein [Candidatus Dojkabacteria bacterium]
MLKLIAGIYDPDKGSTLEVQGRVIPFLELGVGFNTDLTGSENIYLNGTILGMTREFLENKFDEIVSFAELEEFIDEPVKNYSSGMMLKLAFSIAIQAEADIYILDEILAVGDALFQQKSKDVINKFIAAGKTVLFVSHDIGSIQKYCNKVLWLTKGNVSFFGETDDAVAMYNQSLLEAEKKNMKQNQDPNQVGSLEVMVDNVDVEVKDDNIIIKANLKHNKAVDNLNMNFGIYTEEYDPVTAFRTSDEGVELKNDTKTITAIVKRSNLLPGKYYINTALYGNKESEPFHWKRKIGVFMLKKDKSVSKKKIRGVINLEHSWLNE